MEGGDEPLAHQLFKDDSYIISTQQISEILGMTPRNVQLLTSKGALVKVGHGKYDLRRSIKQYIESLMEKAGPADGELDGGREMALWTKARREKTELEVKIIKGELHRSVDVERVMNDMLGAFRARLLSLPSKMAPQVLGKTEIPVIKEQLKEAVFEAMNELADYDPLVFYDTSNDRMFLESKEEEDTPGMDV